MTGLVEATLAALLMGATPQTPSCSPVRVMSYNIRLDAQSDGANRWSERREQLIGQIELMRPAILGLQEVLAGQKADLEAALPDYAFLGVARDDGMAKGEFSNLAIRRDMFELQSSGTFWLSETPDRPSKGWDAAYRRVATFSHVVDRSSGERYLVINTHLDNEGETARLEASRQILRWVSANRLRGEHLVLTGDMNAEAGSPPLRELTRVLNDARKVSKRPAVGPEGTFNNFQPLPGAAPRIDYVLADPSLSVERYAVLAWHFGNGRVASDHFPVVADLCPAGKRPDR